VQSCIIIFASGDMPSTEVRNLSPGVCPRRGFFLQRLSGSTLWLGIVIQRAKKGLCLLQFRGKPQPRMSEVCELLSGLWGCRGLRESHACESVLTAFFGISWHWTPLLT
jgi:hypothetical protein